MKAIPLFAGLVLLTGTALAADSQTSAPNAVSEGSAVVTDGPIDQWGTSSRIFLALTAWDAQPINSSIAFDFVNTSGGQGITRTAGSLFFKVPVQLPAGALVSEVEFNFCDTGATALSASWFRQAKNAAPATTLLLASVGTPGCIVQTATLSPAQTVDNNANSYNIELSLGSTDGTIVFNSLRVGYRLQVSAAPVSATFPIDVPTTHPFYRFVEALAASGITGGCGPGAFCPDQAVTRGQLAVFLASALGMHFPN
jgi:hypothetical protein